MTVQLDILAGTVKSMMTVTQQTRVRTMLYAVMGTTDTHVSVSWGSLARVVKQVIVNNGACPLEISVQVPDVEST